MSLKAVQRHSEHGRSHWHCECECGAEVEIYEWSINGNGSKKCPNCKRSWTLHDFQEAIKTLLKDKSLDEGRMILDYRRVLQHYGR